MIGPGLSGRRAGDAGRRGERHVDLRAGRDGERAARDERAAGQRVAQVGRRAGDADQLPARSVQRGERVQQSPGVGVRGLAHDGRRGAGLEQPARVHDRDPVGQLEQQRQVVGDEQDREAERLLELHDLGQDVPLDHHVERGGRLVHDDDLGIGGQGHRDHHALPHAARQLVRVGPEPVTRDADQVEQGRGLLPGLMLGQLQVRGDRVEDLVLDPEHRVERVHRALEHDRDLAPADAGQFPVAHRQDVGRVAALGDPATAVAHAAAGDQGGRAEQPGRAVGEGRLARAALPAQADHLAGVEREVHVLDGVHIAAR